jgi:hypothetical protein
LISISHYLYRKSGKWATWIAARAGAEPRRPLKSFEKQIPRWLKPARDDKNQELKICPASATGETPFLPRPDFSVTCLSLLLAILLLTTLTTAQIRDRTEHQPADRDQQTPKQDKKTKRGPRAIAVVEFLPGGGTRLVPIALWMDGHFYDASLYGANPAPMALAPETVYQALNYGVPAGWFTVTTPRDVRGNWVAEGQWRPEKPVEAKIAEQAAKQPKPKPKSHDVLSEDQGPPVLRRPGASDTASPGGGQSTAPVSSEGGSSTASGGGSSTANGDTPPKSDDDPDRPTLKASQPSSSSAPSNSKPTLGDNTQQAKAQEPASKRSAAVSPDEDDPNRPVLRRGKPAVRPVPVETADSDAGADKAVKPAPGSSAGATPEASTKVAQAPRSFAAISDAGNYETRSLLYGMAAGERQSVGDPMSSMAMDELRKYAGKHNGPALPKAASITDYDLRGFDLDYSNSPTLVLSAKLSVTSSKATSTAEFEYFVTVVARVDVNGVPQKIFSVVTDTNHLDAYPRMQIIDAIDADANGRGDLLFRQYSDTGISYALYRVFPYQMEKIFEGGAGM